MLVAYVLLLKLKLMQGDMGIGALVCAFYDTRRLYGLWPLLWVAGTMRNVQYFHPGLWQSEMMPKPPIMIGISIFHY